MPELIVYLLTRKEILHIIFEDYLDDRQPKHGDTAYVGLPLYAVHGDLDGCCDKTLLFLGAPAIPLRDDDDLRVSNVREGFYRNFDEAVKACKSNDSHPE